MGEGVGVGIQTNGNKDTHRTGLGLKQGTPCPCTATQAPYPPAAAITWAPPCPSAERLMPATAHSTDLIVLGRKAPRGEPGWTPGRGGLGEEH